MGVGSPTLESELPGDPLKIVLLALFASLILAKVVLDKVMVQSWFGIVLREMGGWILRTVVPFLA